jgi:hypothetical protein
MRRRMAAGRAHAPRRGTSGRVIALYSQNSVGVDSCQHFSKFCQVCKKIYEMIFQNIEACTYFEIHREDLAFGV